ncbi:unnamed protein product [Symbiodinium natans]|uniref:Uncharacterized protein n=1 Tax=Symbiodinium natans TaxID=878477 RepID=A0A812RRG9_9DINO|nr:unnamed protein product [Symbiodinium natans]
MDLVAFPAKHRIVGTHLGCRWPQVRDRSACGACGHEGLSQLEDDMLDALRRFQHVLPRNKRKVAGRMPSKGLCKGCTLGLTTDYKFGGPGTPVVSKATRAHPKLVQVLCRGCRAACPDFKFTSIQVNVNTKYKMHTDGFDAGPSRMVALGDFSRGRLWLHASRNNSWRLVDVRNTWIAFDGREFHLTEEWQGSERYSLVFFTNHLWDQLGPEEQHQLGELGFPWPETADVFPEEISWPDERQHAAMRSWRWLQLRRASRRLLQGTEEARRICAGAEASE